jgi:Replication initiator protein A
MSHLAPQQPAELNPLSYPPRHGHDEKNIAFLPLAILERPPKKGLHTIEYEDQYVDPATGSTIHRKVNLEGSRKDGLPNVQDETVLLGLIYLTYQTWEAARARDPNYEPDPQIFFTIHQLLLVIRWSTTSEYYRRAKKAIARWQKVRITCENWWDSNVKEFFSEGEEGFTILDRYKIRVDGRRRAASDSQLSLSIPDESWQRQRCFITWGSVMFHNLRDNYVKPLDLEKYFALPTAAAKRAYRFLDYELPPAGQPQWYDLQRFACQHVGYHITRPSVLKSKLQASVVKPLEEADFIDKMRSDKRFSQKDGRLGVNFARKASVHAEIQVPALQAASSPEPSAAASLIKELRNREIGGEVARKLVAAHPADYILQKIDYLDYKLETNTSPDDPPAWLRSAIEDDYGKPRGYLPREERERIRQAEAENQRQKNEKALQDAEKARLQKEREEAKNRRDREHTARIQASLTDAERQDLIRRVEAAVDPMFRKYFHDDHPRAIEMRGHLIHRYLLKEHPLPELESAK